MEKLEITSLSSRGQVVIPQEVRERLQLHIGEKFVVIGEEDTIVLKKVAVPSFKGVDKLLQRTRAFAKQKRIRPDAVAEAIRSVRGK